MTTLVFVESADDELSQQAVVMAGSLGAPVSAVAIDAGGSDLRPPRGRRRSSTSPRERGATAIVAAGSDRGNEVMAHVAAKLDQPMAANCIDDRRRLTRGRDPRAVGWLAAGGGAAGRLASAADRAPRTRFRRADRGPSDGRSCRTGYQTQTARCASSNRHGRRRRRLAGGCRRRRLRRPRRRLGRGLFGDRGTGGAAGCGGRLLARGDERRLAPALRPGRPDRHEDLAGIYIACGILGRDAAHGRLQGRQAPAGDQPRRRGVDLQLEPTTG